MSLVESNSGYAVRSEKCTVKNIELFQLLIYGQHVGAESSIFDINILAPCTCCPISERRCTFARFSAIVFPLTVI